MSILFSVKLFNQFANTLHDLVIKTAFVQEGPKTSVNNLLNKMVHSQLKNINSPKKHLLPFMYF